MRASSLLTLVACTSVAGAAPNAAELASGNGVFYNADCSSCQEHSSTTSSTVPLKTDSTFILQVSGPNDSPILDYYLAVRPARAKRHRETYFITDNSGAVTLQIATDGSGHLVSSRDGKIASELDSPDIPPSVYFANRGEHPASPNENFVPITCALHVHTASLTCEAYLGGYFYGCNGIPNGWEVAAEGSVSNPSESLYGAEFSYSSQEECESIAYRVIAVT